MNDDQQAVLQHTLDVANVYKANAHLNRGIPDRPERIRVGQQEATPLTVVEKVKSSILPLALTAAIALGGGGALGGAAYWLSQRNSAPTPEPAPAPDSGSVLQWLEDEGFHLPKE